MPDASQFATYARVLRLTPIDDLPLTPAMQATLAAEPKRRRRAEGIVSLLLLVVLPVCLAAGYFWLLAADRYESEARFVLRTPGRSIPKAELASLLQNSGASRASEDGFVVRDYLESRDAMTWLQHAGLKAALAPARYDPIWRFPSPFSSNTEEGLYSYYRRLVTASYDSSTGMGTLGMQGFTPADAQRFAGSLLDAAEALVNRLNARAQRDAIVLAEGQVDHARQRAVAAQGALTAFREREQLIDPGQATLAVMETIAKLALEASQISVQMNELGQSSPNSPQITALRARRAALEAQIATERQRLAGDARAIAPRIAEYERLMLEREFAEKALMAAMTAVEMARIEAQRQQVYLERVAAPGRPDYPAYPWKVLWCIGILVAGYMTWRIWRILAADALRHTDS
jgi:capsular polysaccharide transport system permease protein